MLPLFYKQDIDNRKHQINTLKIFNDNVKEITEDSEYEIPFACGENNLILKISLANDFPKEKPILSITPSIIHPWLNENGIITSAPGLLNFTIHSDLGRVVQAIIREFQRNPPRLAASKNVISQSIPVLEKENRTSPGFSTNYNFSPPSIGPSVPTKKNLMSHPYQNSIITDLNKLSLEELRFIDENEDRQMEYINEFPYIKDNHRVLDELILEVEELADENLKKEHHLQELKETVDFKIEEVAKLAFENERLYTIYQNFSENYSPRNIQEKLAVAAKKADEDSEKIAESFLQGNLDVDKFLNLFIKTKALCQLRKTKEEKLCHQLDRLEKAGF